MVMELARDVPGNGLAPRMGPSPRSTCDAALDGACGMHWRQ